MEATERTSNNRMVLLLIAGIPVTMVLVATWLWYFVVRGDLDLVGMVGTANHGTLLQPPRQLDEWVLFEQNGAMIKYAELAPRWTMLIPAGLDRCDAICENTLYVTRQIHLAMGKDSRRLRRLFVSEIKVAATRLSANELNDQRPAPASFAAYLATEHRGLQALALEEGGHNGLFAEHGSDPGTWYLVDPAGWVMMSYNARTSYRDVIADLKFLQRNSSE